MAKISETAVGSKFTRLTVTLLLRKKSSGRNRAAAICECSCGTKGLEVLIASLGVGTNSCGCLMLELATAAATTHGMYKSKEYNTWSSMIDRVTNTNNKSHHHYVHLGLDPRWLNFENFYADVGVRPSGDFSLERVDNLVGYFPGNCIWASRAVQNRNKSTNVNVDYKGDKMVLMDAVILLGLKYATVTNRLNRCRWPISRALSPDFSWPDGINHYTGKSDI